MCLLRQALLCSDPGGAIRSSRFPSVIAELASGHLPQPSGKTAAARIELADLPDQGEHRFAHYVLCQMAVALHASVHVSPDGWQVALIQRPPRLQVSSLHAAQQLGITQGSLQPRSLQWLRLSKRPSAARYKQTRSKTRNHSEKGQQEDQTPRKRAGWLPRHPGKGYQTYHPDGTYRPRIESGLVWPSHHASILAEVAHADISSRLFKLTEGGQEERSLIECPL